MSNPRSDHRAHKAKKEVLAREKTSEARRIFVEAAGLRSGGQPGLIRPAHFTRSLSRLRAQFQNKPITDCLEVYRSVWQTNKPVTTTLAN